MGPWGSDLPTRRQPKHRVQQLSLRSQQVQGRAMSSIPDLFHEQLARLIGERTARTRFRRTKDVAGRDMSDQRPLRKNRTIGRDLTANVDR